MSLLGLLAGGMVPPVVFNLDAQGAARHCFVTTGSDDSPVVSERLIPMRFQVGAMGEQLPRLVFVVHDGTETVEVTLADALHFVTEATGIDVAGLLQTFGALAP